jgi:hypothetical protein
MTTILTPGLEFDEDLHAYTLDGEPIPSVTQVITRAGLIDTTFFTEEARDRGRAVHAAAHYLAEDDLDLATVDPRITGYVEAALRALSDMRLDPYLVECSLSHPDLRYAGTFDVLACRDSELWLADYKTGAYHSAHIAQLAAYYELIRANLPHLGMTRADLERMTPIAIYLRRDGRYTTHPVDAGRRRLGWSQFSRALLEQPETTPEEQAI